jgi:hypothetical protein
MLIRPNTSYFAYPTNTPTKEDYYLVCVRPSLISTLGINPSPNVLIAKYTPSTQAWTTVLGAPNSMVGDIKKEVISWCDLPP